MKKTLSNARKMLMKICSGLARMGAVAGGAVTGVNKQALGDRQRVWPRRSPKSKKRHSRQCQRKYPQPRARDTFPFEGMKQYSNLYALVPAPDEGGNGRRWGWRGWWSWRRRRSWARLGPTANQAAVIWPGIFDQRSEISRGRAPVKRANAKLKSRGETLKGPESV